MKDHNCFVKFTGILGTECDFDKILLENWIKYYPGKDYLVAVIQLGQAQRLVTFETFYQSDEGTLSVQQKDNEEAKDTKDSNPRD